MKRFPFPYIVRAVDRADLGRANATHKLGRIRVRRDHRFALPILAQEIAEEDFLTVRHRLPALVAAALVFYFAAPAAGILAGPVAVIVWLMVTILARVGGSEGREMEIRGHAIEAAWSAIYIRAGLTAGEPELRGLTENGYWLREAMTLQRYDQFEGWSLDDISARLLAAKPAAKRWVASNRGAIIRRHAAKFPNDLAWRWVSRPAD